MLASVALAVGMLFLGASLGGMDAIRKAKAQTASARPNFVFILTDDMRKDDLAFMPKTRSLLGGRATPIASRTPSSPTPCAPLPGPPS